MKRDPYIGRLRALLAALVSLRDHGQPTHVTDPRYGLAVHLVKRCQTVLDEVRKRLAPWQGGAE